MGWERIAIRALPACYSAARLERVAFNQNHAFAGPGEAAFAKRNAFVWSGEFNSTQHALIGNKSIAR